MATHFFPLTVKDVRRETKDCVSIAFDVPPELRDTFVFQAGQYVNLRANVDGETLRRSYSLCSAPDSGEWRVAVKRVAGGRFSQFANSKLKAGDSIDVMPPDGKFCFLPARETKRHVLMIAAGSGITPMLSIATTLLTREPDSSITLLYGNRRVRDIIFKEQIEDLRDRFLARFQVVHVLSQEPMESPISSGRIDQEKILSIIQENRMFPSFGEAYICGPETMLEGARSALSLCGMAKERIHFERFAASPVAAARKSGSDDASARSGDALAADAAAPRARMTLIADGIEREVTIAYEGQTVLDVALDAGIDAPYACKAGVCCTCRARVLEGEVRMDANYTLEEHELKRGFVLTCQSRPVTPYVKITYDAR